MVTFTVAILVFALVVWLCISILVILSYLSAPFLNKSRGKVPKNTPLVSILVPAKDEEYNIKSCIKSLLAQDYPNFEVIVIDDRSKDRTYEIAKEYERTSSHLKVVQIKALPQGWTGKSHALDEGVKFAKGEILLFVDADTKHSHDCVTSSMVELEERDLDALSVEPYFAWTSFFQELTFSVFTLITACLFPIFLVNKKGSKITLSNGQYIMIKKKVYDEIGGHKAIKDKILEDLAIAESVKKHGFSYNLILGTDFITVKMYRDMASFWEGWSRILFLALKGNLLNALLLYVVFIAISIFPFMTLFYIISSVYMGLPVMNLITMLGVAVIALIIFANSFVNSFFRINPAYSLLHPLSILAGMAVMGNSIILTLHKKQIEWKGTVYKIDSMP
jgi:chlorobactene glucosyltransferase